MAKHKCYYHLTTKENLKGIMNDGLKCSIGENSKIVNEIEPMIYLCERKDLPYWEILLGKKVILKIDEAGVSDVEVFEYHRYNEIACKKDIDVKYIKRVYISSDKTKAMRELCFSYTYSISRITELAARLNTDSYLERCNADYVLCLKESLSQCLDAFFAVTDRLDYTCLSKKEIREELKETGENGAYTFCDYYLDTGRRLWEQLIHYEESEFMPRFKQLHDYLKTKLRGCLKVDTGGWTG